MLITKKIMIIVSDVKMNDLINKPNRNSGSLIYLDNAATSFPKPDRVIDEIARCMRQYCANPGRSSHTIAVRTNNMVMEVREKISDFFNVGSPSRVCFTKNATEALNIAIRGVLEPGDHVVITSLEHNSVLRPLNTLKRDIGIDISIAWGNKFGEITPECIKNIIKPKTRLVAVTLSSNVNGTILPVKEIGEVVNNTDAFYLVDASQDAGTIPLDMEKMNIDMLAFPGHKGLLGPQGTGALCIRKNIRLKPLMQGGTGSNSKYLLQPDMMPDILESGTLNTPGIVGLGYGLDFINTFGIDNIRLYKDMLLERLYNALIEIKGVSIYSKLDNNSGIVALNIDGLDSTETGYILSNEYGIATRAGFHCSPLAHETIGTIKNGVVRLSLGCFNTIEDVDAVATAIKEIAARAGH
jgi:cysteine desulfurase/selenocysteine lyase